MLNDLEPLPHFVMTDYVRIPVWKSGNDYIVFVGKHHKRRYTVATLPPFISSKITIANVLANEIKSDTDLTPHTLFFCDGDNGDEDTAWRASESLYVVIIHNNQFYELLGDKINKDDT
jgi:hypothetical protein